ncbi:MAG TPA: hypothetical protein VEL03_16050 [Streptosporangiaceae bacterium]|nr:hypothetical protein [Streptosporangiaceae bacterium]
MGFTWIPADGDEGRLPGTRIVLPGDDTPGAAGTTGADRTAGAEEDRGCGSGAAATAPEPQPQTEGAGTEGAGTEGAGTQDAGTGAETGPAADSADRSRPRPRHRRPKPARNTRREPGRHARTRRLTRRRHSGRGATR